MSAPIAPLDRRRVLAWCFFDFANSAYAAVIIATVFSVYFANVIVGNETGRGDQVWGWAISASMAVVALTSPVLGTVADRAGVRKRMLLGFTALCILCVALFGTIRPGMIWWGFTLAVLANVGFEGGLVYYNAYLPDIAPAQQRGYVSGLGYGIGYAGSALGLLIVLPLVNAKLWTATWLAVALFFVVFSIPLFRTMPPDLRSDVPAWRAAIDGVTNFRRILRDALGMRDLRRFLLALFFYIDGVETTVYFASIYAATTLHFTPGELILMFLAVQLAALVGAIVLARPIDRWGPKRVIDLSLVIWVAVAVATALTHGKAVFLGIAVIAGTQLGTVQAASRALMASLIPKGKEAEMFGFYAVVGKSSAILGPIVFGTVSRALDGNQRAAVLAVGVFFVLGLVLLQRVRPASPVTGASPPS
ncbi:MAG TPA: MFS transporter [Gemmatimonadales bacterium]|nr:MFS transporter [Gemmatimonadales bacterium]